MGMRLCDTVNFKHEGLLEAAAVFPSPTDASNDLLEVYVPLGLPRETGQTNTWGARRSEAAIVCVRSPPRLPLLVWEGRGQSS